MFKFIFIFLIALAFAFMAFLDHKDILAATGNYFSSGSMFQFDGLFFGCSCGRKEVDFIKSLFTAFFDLKDVFAVTKMTNYLLSGLFSFSFIPTFCFYGLLLGLFSC